MVFLVEILVLGFCSEERNDLFIILFCSHHHHPRGGEVMKVVQYVYLKVSDVEQILDLCILSGCFVCCLLCT